MLLYLCKLGTSTKKNNQRYVQQYIESYMTVAQHGINRLFSHSTAVSSCDALSQYLAKAAQLQKVLVADEPNVQGSLWRFTIPGGLTDDRNLKTAHFPVDLFDVAVLVN